MYRQILVRPEDRKYQQILWRNSKGDVETFQLTIQHRDIRVISRSLPRPTMPKTIGRRRGTLIPARIISAEARLLRR
jgi:hypothetical protein